MIRITKNISADDLIEKRWPFLWWTDKTIHSPTSSSTWTDGSLSDIDDHLASSTISVLKEKADEADSKLYTATIFLGLIIFVLVDALLYELNVNV